MPQKRAALIYLPLLLAFALMGCQSVYDEEERTFCNRIENRNAKQCAGNHVPDLPPY